MRLLTTQIELNTSNAPICTIVDGYDAVGNRTTRNLDGTLSTWTYDDLYRLTGQSKPGQVATYTLDGVGNLRTMWEGGSFPKTFTHDAAGRLVTMVEGANLTTYTHTAYGALETETTGNQTTSYAYSGQDQLILVTGPSGFPSTYAFSGDGLRRTAQEGNVQPTTMVWDGSDYLLLNEPGGDRIVLTLESEVLACGSKDLLTDPLGSLVKEISSGASLGSLIEMYPYGSLVPGTGTPTIPFVFIGCYGYFKDNADRDYVRARELLKKLARWMQVDPLWPHELAYMYADSSPEVFMDPTGTTPRCICDGCQGTVKGVTGGTAQLRCYQKYCGQRCRILCTIADLEGWCSGNIFQCAIVNRILDPCEPSDPFYDECYGPGGNGPGGQVGGSGCCVECGIRTCCHLTEAARRNADLIWTLAAKKCSKL